MLLETEDNDGDNEDEDEDDDDDDDDDKDSNKQFFSHGRQLLESFFAETFGSE